jgi:signal-transduction protein with cAMP-binding, CBS, and nucleotidyltransferase domain
MGGNSGENRDHLPSSIDLLRSTLGENRRGRLFNTQLEGRYMMSVTKMLKGHELFQSLSFEEIDRVSSFSGVKQYDAGEEVFKGGSVGSHFFVLLEGSVNLRLPAEAHDTSLVVGRMEQGDIFGLAPLLGRGRHTTTARCSGTCSVLAIEAEPLRVMLEQNSPVGLQVMKVAAQAYFSRYVETLTRVQKVVNEIAAI